MTDMEGGSFHHPTLIETSVAAKILPTAGNANKVRQSLVV